jgi:hypothetical protein
VRIGPDNVFVVNGKPAFPVGFTLAPPADGKTPSGGDAYAELKSNGTVFHRCGPKPGEWGAKAEAKLDHVLARSAATGLLAAIWISDLRAIPADDTEKAKELRRVVTKYAGHLERLISIRSAIHPGATATCRMRTSAWSGITRIG